jgi:hypothetical protein
MEIVPVYAGVACAWLLGLPFVAFLFAAIAYIFFPLFRFLLMFWSRRFVYETNQTAIRTIRVDEEIPIYKTKKGFKEKPIIDYLTEKQPVYATKTLYVEKPKYKQVKGTVFKQEIQGFVLSDQNSKTHLLSENESEAGCQTKVYGAQIKTGVDEVIIDVEDGVERIPYQQQYVSHYKTIKTGRTGVVGYNKVLGDVKYVDGFTRTGKKVDAQQIYNITERTAPALNEALIDSRSVILTHLTCLFYIFTQLVSLGGFIYLTIRAKQEGEVLWWQITTPIIAVCHVILIVLATVIMATSKLGEAQHYIITFFIGKIVKHWTWLFCFGKDIVLHELNDNNPQVNKLVLSW